MRTLYIFLFILFYPLWLNGQEKFEEVFTLKEVLEIAKTQSPQAVLATHRFRNSYWEYRTYQAKYRPSLRLSGNLIDYNKSFQREFVDNEEIFVPKHLNETQMSLDINQNIGLTGGQLFVNSSLQRLDVFGPDGKTEYVSTPTRIGYRQPTIKYNELRWERRINPLKFEEAKKGYLEDMESVSLRAVQYFFDLILAQINLEMAEFNYSNADTLFKIAEGRFEIGTIAENERLQMELSFLNSGLALNEARVNLEMNKFRLRSFLGYNEDVDISLIIPTEIPEMEITLEKVMAAALENNPEILQMERHLLEARQNVAQSKAEKGINADIFTSYGLTQSGNDLAAAYTDPLDQQGLQVGIELPILDWGLGRGQHKMALSAMEVIRSNVQQSKIDFEQEVFLTTMQFNLQDDQVAIAAKADTIAGRRYDVTKARFLIGKISVLDLNVSQTEKDQAKRSYISALREYWDYYFTIRSLTLFNFEDNQPITQDYETLMN
ncbi:MAG: TolC family protein [Bacteroidota bacterium]